jgi:hypothetical protein
MDIPRTPQNMDTALLDDIFAGRLFYWPYRPGEEYVDRLGVRGKSGDGKLFYFNLSRSNT